MSTFRPDDDAPSLFDDEPWFSRPRGRKRPEAPAPASSGPSRQEEWARPLADRLRPGTLDEVVGQDHLLAPGAPLARMVEAGRLSSIILWGPPGCGKTTIARLLAARVRCDFEQLSATLSGVPELRRVLTAAARRRRGGRGTLLFIDEIHRFNKTQQDVLLPCVEDGTIVLVGATTENPSFQLTGALLSRCQVLVLHRLDTVALAGLLERAERLTGQTLPLTEQARSALLAMADGDGRHLLGLVEQLLARSDTRPDAPLDEKELADALASRAPLYDKSGDEHYDLISALHKSMRASDPDAALYWLSRMLLGGEDRLYLARRLIRFASEDVGLADPGALRMALAAWDTYERLGSPEGELALAQAVVHLATAPKSVSVYRAFGRAMEAARRTGSLRPPLHAVNAPTRLMKELGHGAGYEYDPDAPDGFSGADFFPEEMERERYYEPTDHGAERLIGERLAHWEQLRHRRQRHESQGTGQFPGPDSSRGSAQPQDLAQPQGSARAQGPERSQDPAQPRGPAQAQGFAQAQRSGQFPGPDKSQESAEPPSSGQPQGLGEPQGIQKSQNPQWPRTEVSGSEISGSVAAQPPDDEEQDA